MCYYNLATYFRNKIIWHITDKISVQLKLYYSKGLSCVTNMLLICISMMNKQELF